MPLSMDAFYSLLQGCINRKDLIGGREVQRLIAKAGFQSSTYLGSHLIRMFAVCGSLCEANQVFISVSKKNVFVWSAIISAYVKFGKIEQALKLYYEMQQSTVKPDKCVFVAVLKACTCVTALTEGKRIHAHIVEIGLELDVFVGSTLIDMYAKCGTLDHARKVFDNLPTRVLVTWNAMIAGYAQCGHGEMALRLFWQIQHEGMQPNNVTFVIILAACSTIAAVNQGKLIHACLIDSEMNRFVGNALIKLYADFKSLKDAHTLFDSIRQRDVVTWTALIAGYAKNGHGSEALQLFLQMQREGVEPNTITFISIVKACSQMAALDQGKLIHALIIERRIEEDSHAVSTLIDMYTKCGSIEDASRVFEKCPKQDMVTLNSMIASYAQHGQYHKVLDMFQQTLHSAREFDHVTYVSVLKACACTAALHLGRLLHAHIIEIGFDWKDTIGTSLISMYTNCGNVMDSFRLFEILPKHSVVIFNAMIAGYALHDNREVLQYLGDIQQKGLRPNDATFVGLLTLCSRMDLVKEGSYLLKSMRDEFGLIPTLQHYSCMVDLLGHAGQLMEAEDLLQTMPCQPNSVGWRSLLHNCKKYGNVEQGKRCFDHVISMEQVSASEYMHMANIYAGADMWVDAREIQDLRHCSYIWKEPGMAFIAVDKWVHLFVTRSKQHTQSDAINAKVCRLNVQLKVEGNVPHLDLVLQ